MRRPFSLAAVLFAAAVWISVLMNPPVYTVNEKADGRYVILTGTVEGAEYAAGKEEDPYLRLMVGNVRIEGGLPQEASVEVQKDEKVLCRITENPAVQEKWAQAGARVRVRGRIRLFRRASNDGEFDAQLYYSGIRNYIFSLEEVRILSFTQRRDLVRSKLYSIRNYLSAAVDILYTGQHSDAGERYASAVKAMLLGQSSLLDQDLRGRFQAAGIMHVICISGLHISMVGTAVFTLLKKARICVPAAAGFTCLVILLYGTMTGMQTSCCRALIMFAFRMAAEALGRTCDMITSLSCAAVLLLAEQPCYLLDSGFLFSFAAVAAIGIAAPRVPAFAGPLVIPLFTLPVQLRFYYAFPVFSILLNMLVIFTAPLIMAGAAAGLIFYVIADQGMRGAPVLYAVLMQSARAASEIPYYLLKLFDLSCEVTEKIPFHSITAGSPSMGVIILYYVILISALLFIFPKKKYRGAAGFVKAATVSAAVFILFFARYEPPLALYMLDVGQGDGLCIRTHDENGTMTVLIDGGSSSRSNLGKYVEIPFLKYHGVSRIDYCIVTHEDLDHCSAVLELLEQADAPGGIEVGHLTLPSQAEAGKGETYRKMEDIACRKGIPVVYLHRGMQLERGNVKIRCMHPGEQAFYEDANACSCVLLLSYDRFSALLTGDLEGQGEMDFLKSLEGRRIETDVLKTAHHGSRGGTSQEFLESIQARTALISCGKNNSYGHPAPETVQRLTEAGMRIYDTRKDGQISVLTDGCGGYYVHTFIDKSK